MLLSFRHPGTSWAQIDESPGARMKRIGYRLTERGALEVWGDYFDTSAREEASTQAPNVRYYHAPLSERLRCIWDSGLDVVDLAEPQPISDSDDIHPNLRGLFSRYPIFLILLLQKRLPH
jgi:hypothetical protein